MRNLILILLAGFALMLGAAGAAQRDDERSDETTQPTVAPATGTGGTEAGLVTGALPADGTVRAAVGDEVELRVASSTPDVAKLLAFGVSTAVGPGLPGTMRFRALAPGRFPVTFDVAGTTAGELVVVEPSAAQEADAAP